MKSREEKSKTEKLTQIKRIMKALLKQGRNSEKVNDIYRELIKQEQSNYNILLENLTIKELYLYYRDKFSWLEESEDKECLDFMRIQQEKVPFDFKMLKDSDWIENESGEKLIYDLLNRNYLFINNDITRFLSKNAILQNWKKL